MPRDRLLRRLPIVPGLAARGKSPCASRNFRHGLLAALLLGVGACVYRIDIQQGNLLEEDVIEQVELGMTRSQVQFLLGTPMIADSFHQDRWDYTYYFRRGRSRDIDQRWLIVFFEDDVVVRIDRDPTVFPIGR